MRQVMRKDRILEKDHSDYVRAERDILTSVLHPYIVTLRYSFQAGRAALRCAVLGRAGLCWAVLGCALLGFSTGWGRAGGMRGAGEGSFPRG